MLGSCTAEQYFFKYLQRYLILSSWLPLLPNCNSYFVISNLELKNSINWQIFDVVLFNKSSVEFIYIALVHKKFCAKDIYKKNSSTLGYIKKKCVVN